MVSWRIWHPFLAKFRLLEVVYTKSYRKERSVYDTFICPNTNSTNEILSQLFVHFYFYLHSTYRKLKQVSDGLLPYKQIYGD